MTDAEFREALELLDSAHALLRCDYRPNHPAFMQELRRLTMEFDLLRMRLRQAPAESCRN